MPIGWAVLLKGIGTLFQVFDYTLYFFLIFSLYSDYFYFTL